MGKTFSDQLTYPLDPFVAVRIHPVIMGLDLAYIVGPEGGQNSMSSSKEHGGTGEGS